jgi:SAM-dependent methyltransferase
MVKSLLKRLLRINVNETRRNDWLARVLRAVPPGHRLLDAGAGELRNKPLCAHLNYVSQDVCEYKGQGDSTGLHTGTWDTSRIDLVCDIVNIPEPDAAFDAILCSEVFEHLPNAILALDEFSRLLKPGGRLIITAPFASLVHFAPYHYATGFSRYWYEYHLSARHFAIQELASNGDWFSYAEQEIMRLPSMARKYRDWCWPLSYLAAVPALLYFRMRGASKPADDVACFGWHCVAVKSVAQESSPA